jgi:hypothetical protein
MQTPDSPGASRRRYPRLWGSRQILAWADIAYLLRRQPPPDPENAAYWKDPAVRHWARHSSVYDDRGEDDCG